MQNTLRNKLAELRKKDFSSFFPDDFANKSWVDIVDEEEERLSALSNNEEPKSEINIVENVEVVSSAPPQNVETNLKVEPNENADVESPKPRCIDSKVLPKPKEGWSEPRMGWCQEEQTITRREKEILRMKDRQTYKRYLATVPKFARQKSQHPRTPNKYLNWSRRSWDKQVKLWKLAVYEWAGETPTSSVNASYCPSECSDEDGRASPSPSSIGPSTPKRIKLENDGNDKHREEGIRANKILNNLTIPSNSSDAMASLLGHFDFDTLREAPTMTGPPPDDESTLKALPVKGPVTRSKSYALVVAEKSTKGPTDFSHLIPVKAEAVVQKENVQITKTGSSKRKAAPVRGKK